MKWLSPFAAAISIRTIAISTTATNASPTAPSASAAVPSSNNNADGDHVINSPPAGPLPAVDVEDGSSAAMACSGSESSDGTCSNIVQRDLGGLNDKKSRGKYYCVRDDPRNTENYELFNALNCFHDNILGDEENVVGDFVSPHLEPGQVAPIIWRHSVDETESETSLGGKIATQYAYQIGVPPELITTLLDYCNSTGITDALRKFTLDPETQGGEPIPAGKDDHNGKFIELLDGNRWYAQRPAKKWRSNMHWISPADEKTHEEYLSVLGKGNFDLVLKSIGEQLGLDGLVAYHLTFIGVSQSVRGYVHHDTQHTGGSVYNVIIPLMLEDDVDPELIIVDDEEERKGGFKYRMGSAALMGDDAEHGTLECDYLNITSKHFDDGKVGGMRLAATVYIADVNEENVDAVTSETLTQIFPLADTKWLMSQRGRHWRRDGEGKTYSIANDPGRKKFRFEDKYDDCYERAEDGMCESDQEDTRVKCLKSCRIYIEEGPTTTRVLSSDGDEEVDEGKEVQVEVCVQNRTGYEECKIHVDDTSIAGDFVSPSLEPGEMFPILWRNDNALRTTDYAFQVGLPPELTQELLDYCNWLGITDLFRSLVGDSPIEAKESHTGKFFEMKDGNRWYAQRPAKHWLSNMHWISPADEKTHEEYLKVLAKGNFDLVLDAIGKYLGLDGLVAYHLTFIGVSHSVKGYMHRDTYETGGSVYNVIIPLILDEDALPELAIADDYDDERVGALKYRIGAAAMMGDDAMHGTEACDYRDKNGFRMAATVYIADINEVNAKAISDQTLTQIFPLPDIAWLLTQRGRHWDGVDGGKSLVSDGGRQAFWFYDKLDDCKERAEKGMCESDTMHTRTKCLRSCRIYESDHAPGSALLEICSKDDAGELTCRRTVDSGLSDTFVTPMLHQGEVFGIYSKQTGKKASPNSYQLSIPSSLTTALKNHCRDNGLLDQFRSHLDGNDDKFFNLEDGNRWHVRRSNLSDDVLLFSPADEIAHESFIDVLAEGDFDSILQTVGNSLDLQGLAVYQTSLVAYLNGGDFINNLSTTARVFNVIIPLEPMALSINGIDSDLVGKLMLEPGSGLAVGDFSFNGFAKQEISDDEIVFAASIYIADIGEDNVDEIIERSLTQPFPPPNKEFLLAQRGRHWGDASSSWNDHSSESFEFSDKLDDCVNRASQGLCESDIFGTRFSCPVACGVFLPDSSLISMMGKNADGHDRVRLCITQKNGRVACNMYLCTDTAAKSTFISPSLEAGDAFPITFRNNAYFQNHIWRFGLPVGLRPQLMSYLENLGILVEVQSQISGDFVAKGSGKLLTFGIEELNRYYIERPSTGLDSNELFFYPADEHSHESVLQVLAEGGFDDTLGIIGTQLGLALNHLAVYHVAFTAVSYAEAGAYSVSSTGGKAFSVMIPLLADNSCGVLSIKSNDNHLNGTISFEEGIGIIIGDGVKHGFPECDRRVTGGINLSAIIYIAELDDESTPAIINSLDHVFPPRDKEWFDAQARRHWGGRSSLKSDQGRLPMAILDNSENCESFLEEGKCDSEYRDIAMKCQRTCRVLNEYEEGSYVKQFFAVLQNDDECVDLSPECIDLAKQGLCMTDKEYMEEMGCHFSCLYCLSSDSQSIHSVGVSQSLQVDPAEEDDYDEYSSENEPTMKEVMDIVATTEDYLVNVILTNEEFSHVRLSCQNYDEKCSYWAAKGQCEDSPGWMGKHCAAACLDCFMVELEHRCPIDYESDIVGPGDLGKMFERWLEESGQDPSLFSMDNPPSGTFNHPNGKLSVISSPYDDMDVFLTEEEKNSDEEFQPLPWIISIDGFLSDEECDKLIEYGSIQGYERSTEYGSETNVDGSVTFVESDARTSTNSWCNDDCAADPVVQGVIDRIVQMTEIPPENYESLQLVRYQNGQFYKQHHDFAQNHSNSQYGPRLLTFFLYLNDLEEDQGGGTKFAHLNFTAKPKRGMALIWPSVSVEDPYEMDDWTWHEAMPVLGAVKYGANAWIHLRNFQDVEDFCSN